MANQYAAEQAPSGTKKLLLGRLYTDAPVRTEPEEPQKIITAGLAEARPVKDYPDTFFGRALKVFRGEFKTLLKSMLFFIPFAAAFIVIFAWFADYFEKLTLGGIYNFMGGIGIGYPGGGDSLAESVGRLFWDVKEPVLLMLGATLIFGSLGLAGNFYCAKRSYFQDYYSKTNKTFWMGFAKYWWMFLITGTVAVLIGCGMGTALIYLLRQQTLGAADAGAYCAVVFSWVFGTPLMLIPMVMMSLFTTYELTFFQAFKNAIVIIVNNPVSVCVIGVVSAIPFIIFGTAGMIMGVIVFAVMLLAGCNLYALLWIAMANRGMTKCHQRKAANDLVELQKQRHEAKKKAKQGEYSGAAGGYAKKKPKQQVKPYQNPKKKKKK